MRKSILFATLLAVSLGSTTAAFAQGGHGGGGHGGSGMGGMGISAQHNWQIQQQHRIQAQPRYQYGRPMTSGNQLHYLQQNHNQHQIRIMPR